jgi:adenylate cyclase, class 2
MNLIQYGNGKEYEAKFLDVDVSNTRDKIKKLGGKLVHPKTKYIRAVFKRATNKVNGYARVRDEGGSVTMTVKIYNNPKFPDEFEVSINEGFVVGRQFLQSLGLKEKAFQESYREKWSFPKIKGGHEVTFDELPGLPIYMEIDCTSEKTLNKMVKLLDVDKSKMRFGAFDATYEEYYGILKNTMNSKTESLSFSNIINEIKPKKNKELLKKIALVQKKLK